MRRLFLSVLVAARARQIAAVEVVNSRSCANNKIRQWLYSSDVSEEALTILDRPEIEGVQAIYRWKQLEPVKDNYDFSQIHTDLAAVRGKGKRLWIQLQDRTFNPRGDAVPKYLKMEDVNSSIPQCGDDGCDGGAEVLGWVAAQWNPLVSARFQTLLEALAKEFDGKVYGLNFPETSIAISQIGPLSGNFTPQAYFDATLGNAKFGASLLQKSYVVQYVNFWPNGTHNMNNYMADSFKFIAKHGIGIGGPDNLPYRQFQVENSYSYLWEYRNKVPVSVVAVQEPDLSALSPNTSLPYTKDEFVDYAIDHLGSKIIFWAISSPWLSPSNSSATAKLDTRRCSS